FGASDSGAGAVDEGVVAEVTREPDIDPVGVLQQLSQLIRRRETAIREVARVGEKSGAETLDPLIGKRAPPMDAIADAVVEGANAKAIEINLRGVGANLVVRGVAEVEAFAVEVDLRTVDAVRFRSKREESLLNVAHVVGEQEAHNVEAEAIDIVFAGIKDESVDDELFHHEVFASGIRAAGSGFEVSV